MVKCCHELKKVYMSMDLETEYYYFCYKCNSYFSREQIDGYLMKDWRIQAAQYANNGKQNKKTIGSINEVRLNEKHK